MEIAIRFCIGICLVCLVRVVQCQLPGGGGGPPTYSRTLETALRTELFTAGGYSELQRPDERTGVAVSMTILTVNDLDIKNQVMSVSGYLSLYIVNEKAKITNNDQSRKSQTEYKTVAGQTRSPGNTIGGIRCLGGDWTDGRLSWSNTSSTSQDYSNIRFLFSTEAYVWRPAIIIENSVEDISVISDKNIPMRIASNGRITWNPAGIYLVACSSDITYYPLDEQTCSIKVTTWGYTSNEISLHFDANPIDMSFYSENGEWLLIDAKGEKSKEKSRGGQTFSSLTFSVTLQRRPMFHALNTIVPVILMAFLIPMVYKLPVDSGEKIGYSLTVLLAYAVYLSLISDNIPSTSVTVCYLTVFLLIVLALSVLSVAFVILVIAMHHHGDRVVSARLTRIGHFMAVATCDGGCSCCCTKKQHNDTVKPFKEDSNKLPTKVGISQIGLEESETDSVKEMTYQDFSKILDKFLFLVYMLIVLLTTMTFSSLGLIHYATL